MQMLSRLATKFGLQVIDVRFNMNQWGVAVLELDNHPNHNKGSNYAPCAGT